jgi:putative tryptophan/tyrosine transport system substrate-binding protein
MKRRQFMSFLGGAAVWPLAADAEQAGMPVIGFFGVTSPSAAGSRTASFVQRLQELGWMEGRTAAIEYQWAEGRSERFAEIAHDLVMRNVAVIVTAGAGPVIASMRATSSIPIVFAVASDPVGTGLVASLPRPGGNVTGLSYQGPDVAGKRLELLREALPRVRRVAVLASTDAAGAMQELGEVRGLAARLGLEVIPLEVRRAEDIARALAPLHGHADAVYVCADPLANTNRAAIVAQARTVGLATIFGERENVEAGGMLSYGPSIPHLYRRAAELVDKILRGTKPADIPVEQPTKCELVINLMTARALSVEVPPTLLARADEVIE